jgi:alcohol dehydrogenase (NADP+)
MCGGITVFSPLKFHGAGPGKSVGIVGVGGLGHFAVLFAKAFGADEVVGISRRESKRADAINLGCDDYIATSDDADWVKKNSERFDLIISTVSSNDVCGRCLYPPLYNCANSVTSRCRSMSM